MDLDDRIRTLDPYVLLRCNEGTVAAVVNAATGASKLAGWDAAKIVVGAPTRHDFDDGNTYTSKSANIKNADGNTGQPSSFNLGVGAAITYAGAAGLVPHLGDAAGLEICAYCSHGPYIEDYNNIRALCGGYESAAVNGFDVALNADTADGDPATLHYADLGFACVRAADAAGHMIAWNFAAGNVAGNDGRFRKFRFRFNPKLGTAQAWCDKIEMPLVKTTHTGTHVSGSSVFNDLSAGKFAVGGCCEGATLVRSLAGVLGRWFAYESGKMSDQVADDLMKDAYLSARRLNKVICRIKARDWDRLFSDTALTTPVPRQHWQTVKGVRGLAGTDIDDSECNLTQANAIVAPRTFLNAKGKLLGLAFKENDWSTNAIADGSIAVVIGVHTLTRTSGSWIDDFTALSGGTPPAPGGSVALATFASNSGTKTISTVTDKVITVTQTLTAETGTVGLSFAAGTWTVTKGGSCQFTAHAGTNTITRPYGSWVDDLTSPSDSVAPVATDPLWSNNWGADAEQNNGQLTVAAVTQYTLTVAETLVDKTAGASIGHAKFSTGMQVGNGRGLWPPFCSIYAVVRPLVWRGQGGHNFIEWGSNTAIAQRSTIELGAYNGLATCLRSYSAFRDPDEVDFPMIHCLPGRACFVGFSTGIDQAGYRPWGRRFFEDGVFGKDENAGALQDGGAWYYPQLGGFVGCNFRGYQGARGIIEEIIVCDAPNLDDLVQGEYDAWMAENNFEAPDGVVVGEGDSISCCQQPQRFQSWQMVLAGDRFERYHFVNFSQGSSQYRGTSIGTTYDESLFYGDASYGPRLVGSWPYPKVHLWFSAGINDVNLGDTDAVMRGDLQALRTAMLGVMTPSTIYVQKLYHPTAASVSGTFNPWLDTQVGTLWTGTVDPARSGAVDLATGGGDGTLHPGSAGHLQIGQAWLRTLYPTGVVGNDPDDEELSLAYITADCC